MEMKMRLLTPGPTPLPDAVREALGRDMIHHRKPGFKRIMHRVQDRLRQLFGTSQPVMILSSSGTGAMVAAVHNLFKPGERVLVVEGGKFGERWREIAQSWGLETEILPVEWGRAVDPDAVRAALDRDPSLRGVLVQASETSTGVLHPVRELGEITRNRDTLLVVDGISAVGVSPCPMDAWHVDCLLTGSQKGLMLPPGLALAALSPRALERARKVATRNFYLDLPAEHDSILKNQTRFTSPIGLIVGLDVCLDLILTPGLEALYRKQWALTRMAREGAQALGLPLLAPDSFTWGLTSVRLPESMDGAALLGDMAEGYNIVMAGGQGHLKGRIVRIGHMGHVDMGDLAAGLYALARACLAQGHEPQAPDYLERALAACEDGLEHPPALV